MWVRLKHRFAYGEDRKWSYIEIPDDWAIYGYDEKAWKEKDWRKDKPYDMLKMLGEYLVDEERVCSSYDHSDKYRGIKYDIVDGLPPNDELMSRLKRAKSSLEHYKSEVDRFQAMVDQTGTIKKEDFEV